jgi:cobalamin-dependent methionine synthase I
MIDALTDPQRRGNLVARVHAEALQALEVPEQPALSPAVATVRQNGASGPPSHIQPAPISPPPFWGVRTLDGIELRRVFKHLALRSLFRLSWGARNTSGSAWTRLLKDDFMPRLRHMQREAIEEGWMRPRAVYGYFPCYREGDDVHRHIRRELGLGTTQGKRYSWGYPACPDLEDHARVFRLLPATELIGVELTSAYQLVPEQSTAAIIAHHPKARYFSVRAPRHQAVGVAGD